ncbi:HEPN domain-containing protein [Candidatus Dojkabacteria bacterium]|uniref:HEPN domain-containing protein n=1 Tax=Candidatus Dojkabacteria bacterium TaxID=2099670 RepID=A0A955L9I2_9BACT|nr:HEPN domain-containing protein [Candidatus Dojkabacteria bacterium]
MSDQLVSSQKNRYYVWLEQSKYDLEAAQNSFKMGSYEWTCYQSLQSVEKCIKAVIVHAGFRPPKVHKLGVLMGMANKANPNFINISLKFRKIESYTFISRYPFVIPGQNKTPHELINKEDGQTCLDIAMDVHATITSFIKENTSRSDKDLVLEDYYFKGDEVQKRIDVVIDELKKCENLNIHKIILFGGFAREYARPKSSTMDILIVADTKLSFIERIQYVREITRGGEPIIEPLIYTPEEFRELLEEEGEGFLESALDEGKVLFEK